MTGKTHRVGGVLSVLSGFLLLDSNGMLLSNINPAIQLVAMYPFAIYGSTFSDLDHNWDSSPSKDVVSYVINKSLHLTTKVVNTLGEDSKVSKVLSIFNARHRSWQTHSDLFLFLMVCLCLSLFSSNANMIDVEILRLISSGFTLGVISHLILDMITPEGIWSILLVAINKLINIFSHSSRKFRRLRKRKIFTEKLSLVPNTEFFRTGGTWETLIRSIMWAVCLILLFKVIYNFCPYTISFN